MCNVVLEENFEYFFSGNFRAIILFIFCRHIFVDDDLVVPKDIILVDDIRRKG